MSEREDYHNIDLSKLTINQLRSLERDVEYTISDKENLYTEINDAARTVAETIEPVIANVPSFILPCQGNSKFLSIHAKKSWIKSNKAIALRKNIHNNIDDAIVGVLLYSSTLHPKIKEVIQNDTESFKHQVIGCLNSYIHIKLNK